MVTGCELSVSLLANQQLLSDGIPSSKAAAITKSKACKQLFTYSSSQMSLFVAHFKPFYILESVCIYSVDVVVTFTGKKNSLSIKEDRVGAKIKGKGDA